ncbi:MAG TPA: cytochrome P450 [Acidimicrobiia bacterium]|jgi:cytochrome P450|nr:cytochrome P450 [Acidimicrobiia bacterium]
MASDDVLAPAEEYDPFEDFNRSAGIGVVENPYPLFAMARAHGSLLKEDLGDLSELAEMTEQGMTALDIPDVYTAFGFDAVQTVLRDGDTFSSAGYAEVIGAVMGHTILEMDEPEHHTYRALVQQAFSRKAMDVWESDLVRDVVDEHIDHFIDRGHADLVRELTFPFPVVVIARLLGLPREDLPRFHRLAVELISVAFDMDRGLAASAELNEYFCGIIAERRAHPQNDVISVLEKAELDGQRLTDDEIVAFLRLLLPAGAETTYRSSSNLLYGLLTNPAQLDALRADRALMPQAIEEGLRWEPPLLTIMRTATRDTVVDGFDVKAGATIVVNMGSANHDEKYWENADQFDMFRAPRQHLAFAFGPHMCLGLHLARMETRVVLSRLLDRLPNLRLDADAEAPFITGMTFRAPNHLPVVF